MDDPENISYTTGGLRILPDAGRVESCSGSERLAPINMRILTALVDSHGRVLTRAELFDHVWPNQVVGEDALTKSVSEVRNTLEKLDGDRKFIQTIPKKGYQWLPEVEKVGERPAQMAPRREPVGRLLWAGIAALALAVAISGWLLSPTAVSRHSLALLPLRAESPPEQQLARMLEQELRSRIVAEASTDLLSAETAANLPQNSFSYLHNEFDATYIIEGAVHAKSDGLRVTLNLVDARTAIVLHTHTREIQGSEEATGKFAGDYVLLLSRLLE